VNGVHQMGKPVVRPLPGIEVIVPDVTGLPADQPRPPLPWYRSWIVRLLVFAGCFVAASLGVVGLMSAAGVDQIGWLYSFAQIIAAVVAYAVVCLLEGRRHPIELAPSRVGGVLTGLPIGALAMLLVFGLAVALGAREVRGFNPHYSPWEMLAMVGLGAGIAEEIIFRGILYRLVEGWLGTWVALAVSAAVFGGVHLTNPEGTVWGAVAIALEAGIMFGLLYAVTRSLWVVMGVHAAWNVMQGPILGSAISGATRDGDGFVRSYATGPELLSGGVFGLEASILSVVLMLAFSAVLLRVVLQHRLVVPPFWVRRRRDRELSQPTG